MYCKYCGYEVNENAYVCVNCGCKIHDESTTVMESDTGNKGWAVLGYFVPLVGLVLYLLWKEERPKDAKMAGKGALFNVICKAILAVAYIVFLIVMFCITSSNIK